LQKNGLSWSDYWGLNQIKREQLSPQSPVNKKAHAGRVPAYAPTDKEREIVETAAGSELSARRADAIFRLQLAHMVDIRSRLASAFRKPQCVHMQ
jgi:hypothetical protein